MKAKTTAIGISYYWISLFLLCAACTDRYPTLTPTPKRDFLSELTPAPTQTPLPTPTLMPGELVIPFVGNDSPPGMEEFNYPIESTTIEVNTPSDTTIQVRVTSKRGTTGYKMHIQRITRQDRQVRVYAILEEPLPLHIVGPMVTYPYDLAKIDRQALGLEGMVEFILFMDTQWTATVEVNLFEAAPTPTNTPCPAGERSVPFVTVERRYSSQEVSYDPPIERWYYRGKEALIKVFTQPDQILRLGDDENFRIYNLNQETNLGEVLDFDIDLAAAIFQGLKSSTGYGVEIQCITVHDGGVLIYTHFIEPAPGQGVGDMVTSPYEIVKIRREDLGLDGTIEFTLIVDETALAIDKANLSK